MRKLSLVLGGLLLVTAVVSANLWRELRAERAVSADLRTQLANSAGAATLVHQPVPAAAREATSAAVPAPAAAASASASAAEVKPAAPTSPASLQNFILDQQEMMKDPEYRAARLAQMRMTMAQTNPGLVEALGLNPDETSRLYDLLAEFQMESSNATLPTIVANGQQPDPAALQQAMGVRAEIQRRENAAVSAMLGQARYTQFQQYQQDRSAYMQAANMTRIVESAGQPSLNETQTRAMREVYIAEGQRQRQDMQAMMRRATQAGGMPDRAMMMEEQMKQQAERNARIVEAASRHLQPAQVEALRASMEQQLAMSRVSSRMALERAEAQQRTGN